MDSIIRAVAQAVTEIRRGMATPPPQIHWPIMHCSDQQASQTHGMMHTSNI